MDTPDFLRRYGALGLFLGTFALYLHTLGPSLVPYRDAGEMAASVTHLGILHPPGYPMYSLLGHLFSLLPLANPAYRLNLLSAIAMAGAWGILFCLWKNLWDGTTALLAALLGAASSQFWTHALVSEMYTLHLLILSILFLLIDRRQWNLAAFIFGIGIGLRIDLVLSAPALLILVAWEVRHALRPTLSAEEKLHMKSALLRAAGFFALGASAYLYLLIRAHRQPVLNWGDPSTLDRFWASIVRRSYSGTLDLLSKSYRSGENFIPEFILYVRHLARDFSYFGVLLAVLGTGDLWKHSRNWFWALAAGWIFTGPLFIYLGNLPPNPHAVAIMEAAYLAPDFFYLFAIAAGLASLRRYPFLFNGGAVLLALVIAVQSTHVYSVVNKRQNWFAMDFIGNVFRSIPEPSLVVARSDVPVFSLFYGHWMDPRFKWRIPIAQGLASAAWYQVMMDQQVPKLDLAAMNTAAEWETTARTHPGFSLYGTFDTDWTPDLFARMVPSGLVMQWVPRGPASIIASDTRLNDFAVYRGTYRYDAHRDFFSPELIEEYAKAWMEWGRLLLRSHQDAAAIEAFTHALVLKPDLPYAAFQIGFIYFDKAQYDRADYYYRWCLQSFDKMDRESETWKSFPSVREGIRRDEAQAMAHWGVIQERRGHPDAAVEIYHRALSLDSGCSDARYNLAVIFWRARRWADVVEQLQALSASHPEDMRWRAYLPRALEQLKAGK